MCEPIDDLPRAEFAKIFGGDEELEKYLAFVGVKFGQPGYDWCATAAFEWRELYFQEAV